MPQSLIIRYRGNRLHVLFKLAAVYVIHFDLIKKYLTGYCLHTSTLKTCLIEDFQNLNTLLELKVLALIGKLLTGPWIKRFYKNHEDGLHHLDAFSDIKRCSSRVEDLVSLDVIRIGGLKEDFFGDPIEKTDRAIWDEDVDIHDFSQVMKGVLNSTLEVIMRQYKTYFEMTWDDSTREKLSSARTHNMDSEEVMDMFSAMQERAPAATLLYISSKIRAKKTKTVNYLHKHPDSETVIMQAVPIAAKFRRKTQKSVADLQKEMSRRIIEKQQKKSQVDRKKMEKQVIELMSTADADLSLFPSHPR
ncbi:hypothetical protein SNE40_015313 [Patella caerulea]